MGPPTSVFNEESLRGAYGQRMALVQIGGRHFAIDVGSHAEEAGVGDA